MKLKNILLLSAMGFSAFTMAQNANGRITLVETFTSSTCPPCNPGNVALEGLLANSTNDGKYASLKYQMSWPGSGDPYFTNEGDVRRNFYSVSGIPQTFVDAGYGGNPSSMTQNNLNSAYAIDPKFEVTAFYTIDEANQKVDIQIDIESLFELSPGSRMFCAIYEHTTDNNVGGNGETEFEQVMKKMLPSAAGTVLSPMTTGQTNHYDFSYTFNGTYRLPPNATDPIDNNTEHSVEEFSDLGVIVWVQKMSGDHEIYQAVDATMGSAGLEEATALVGDIALYPNPASDMATVVFHTTQIQDVDVELYDITGVLVSTESRKAVEAGRVQHNLNLSGLPAGMYTVRVMAGGVVMSRRLTVK
jgi:hypothetical protein